MTAQEFRLTLLLWLVLAFLLSLTPLFWWSAALIAFVIVYGGFLIISGDFFGDGWGW